MKPVIDGVMQGLNAGLAPELAEDGTAGTYFLRNAAQKNVAVFKPIDEECKAPNNPRGLVGKFGEPSSRNGILSGECSVREICAYLIDKPYPGEITGFSGVPMTVLASISHPSFKYLGEQVDGLSKYSSSHLTEIASIIMYEPDATMESHGNVKYGSLQEFVRENEGTADNWSSDLFSDDEVHKIAILDMRILNADRNSNNILVRKFRKITIEGDKKKKEDCYSLIPIDHGMSIPSTLDITMDDYCWLSEDYQQKDHPFSKRTLSYIKSIDVDSDIEFLNSQFRFRPICLRNIKMSTIILKRGAEAGLTLAEIAKIWARTDCESEQKSVFEKIVGLARTQADICMEMSNKNIYHPLSFSKKSKKKIMPDNTKCELISMDMEALDKMKEKPYFEEMKRTTTRRGRANTMLEDNEEAVLAAPKLEAGNSAGLAVIKEIENEEIKVSISKPTKDQDLTADLQSTSGEDKTSPLPGLLAIPNGKMKNLEEEKNGYNKLDLPPLMKTASIPVGLSVFFNVF